MSIITTWATLNLSYKEQPHFKTLLLKKNYKWIFKILLLNFLKTFSALDTFFLL